MKWLGLYCGPALSKDKNRQIILTIKKVPIDGAGLPAGILAPVVNANLAGISAPLTGLF